MLIKNLFETVILEPAQQDADALYIIAGFASAAFATDCLSEFKTYSTSQRRVQLILGMTPFVPNMQAQHNAFKELANTHYPAQFECRYIIKAPYVHIKAYAWYKQNAPYKGFIGSANYTRQAFRGKQRECVEFASPVEILSTAPMKWGSDLR